MLVTILQELRDMKVSQAREISQLHDRLTKMEENLGNLPRRITEVEARVSALEDNIISMQKDLQVLNKNKCQVDSKLQDLENYNRRSNLRLVGISEGLESAEMVKWTESLLKKAIPELQQSPEPTEYLHIDLRI